MSTPPASAAAVAATTTTTTTAPAGATAAMEIVRLWPAKAPLARGDAPADVPEMTIVRPKRPDGSVIVVCPGGGYARHAPHEAGVVAEWLNTFGVTGAVLKYRVTPYRHPAPLADVSRAIRTIRHRAAEWKLDAKRVGVLGFSAGGHVAATVSTQFDADDRAPDEINQLSSRPDVSVLLYPVITLDGVSAHVGSRRNLLGDDPTQEQLDAVSADRRVTPHTPPAFLFHTVADTGVPVENSILYATALRKAGVAFEMHLFEPGRHGVGLADKDPVLRAWPGLCETWLRGKGFGAS